MLEKLYEYIEDIKSGRISAGFEVKQSVSRFENDILREDIYFDEYNVSNDVVTISGYWRLKGMTWNKCEGSLSFRDNNFIPHKIESKRTTVEIISESCK